MAFVFDMFTVPDAKGGTVVPGKATQPEPNISVLSNMLFSFYFTGKYYDSRSSSAPIRSINVYNHFYLATL